LLSQFGKQVANSRIEAGAEVLDAVNDFYKSVQHAHQNGVPAAAPIFDEMKKRYIANGRKKATSEPKTS
jgi:ADP-dependent phosphofructokinase/glucokinase